MSGVLHDSRYFFENESSYTVCWLVSIESLYIPRSQFPLEERLFFLEIGDALFGGPLSGHDCLWVEVKIKGDIWFGQIRFDKIGSGSPEKNTESVLMWEREILKMNQAIEERSVRKKIVVSFAFQSGNKASEAKYIEEEEFLTEQERENRSSSDSFFLAGLEVFLFFENSHEAIGEREFNCMKIGHFVTFADQVFFEKLKLGGFAAAIHAGKSDVFHEPIIAFLVVFWYDSGVRKSGDSIMIKVLIFDFDGVIEDNYELHFELSQKQITGLTREEHRKLFEGNLHVERAKLEARNTGFDLKKHFNSKKLEATINPEIKETLVQLSKRYTLGIISSAQEYGIHGYCKKNQVDGCFFFVYGVESGILKSEKFVKVLHEYSVVPDECLFITDTLGDILEANEAGIRTIAIDSGFHERERLEKGKPLHVISRLSDLTTVLLRF